MAFTLIQALRKAGISYVVAPYEGNWYCPVAQLSLADAQLAYLDRKGIINAIISEDSDLLCFGCSKVLYKLQPDGSAIQICQDQLGSVPGMKNWTLERFRHMCILSGCDYLASPPGIGVKTAIKLLERSNAYVLIKSWKTWGSAIKAPKLPPEYSKHFQLAEWTFLYQRVYDPTLKKLVTLHDLPGGFEMTEEISNCIGPDMDATIAEGVCTGMLDPDTKEPFVLSAPLQPAQPVASNSKTFHPSTFKQAPIQQKPNPNSLKLKQNLVIPNKMNAKNNIATTSVFKQLFASTATNKKIEKSVPVTVVQSQHSLGIKNLQRRFPFKSVSGPQNLPTDLTFNAPTKAIALPSVQSTAQPKSKNEKIPVAIEEDDDDDDIKIISVSYRDQNENQSTSKPLPHIRDIVSERSEPPKKQVKGLQSNIILSKQKPVVKPVAKPVAKQRPISAFFGLPKFSPYFVQSKPAETSSSSQYQSQSDIKDVSSQNLITDQPHLSQASLADTSSSQPKPGTFFSTIKPPKPRFKRLGLSKKSKK